MQVGDTARYCLTDGNAWEVGVGTYAASNTLVHQHRGEQQRQHRDQPVRLGEPGRVLMAGAAQLAPTLGGSHYLTGALVSGVGGTLPRLDVYVMSGSYTWTKQAGAALVDIVLIGAGGNRAGAVIASGTAFLGGSGAGPRNALTVPAALLPATGQRQRRHARRWRPRHRHDRLQGRWQQREREHDLRPDVRLCGCGSLGGLTGTATGGLGG